MRKSNIKLSCTLALVFAFDEGHIHIDKEYAERSLTLSNPLPANCQGHYLSFLVAFAPSTTVVYTGQIVMPVLHGKKIDNYSSTSSHYLRYFLSAS